MKFGEISKFFENFVSNQRSFSFPLRGWSLLNVVLLFLKGCLLMREIRYIGIREFKYGVGIIAQKFLLNLLLVKINEPCSLQTLVLS